MGCMEKALSPEKDAAVGEVKLGYFTETEFSSLTWRTKRIVIIDPRAEHRRHPVYVKSYELSEH